MRIRYSSRLFLYLPFAVLLVLAFASMLGWKQLANDFEQRLLAANSGREIMPGVTLHFGSEAISGVPFDLDAVLDNVTFTVKATRGPFIWHTEHLAIHALTYGRAQQVFEAAGIQMLSWTDSRRTLHRFQFVPGSLRASAIETDGRLVRFDLDIDSVGARDLSGARVQIHLRNARDAIDVVISADALRLAPALQTGFGPEIARVLVSGRLLASSAFLPLLMGMDEWRDAVEKWRNAGGLFVLDHLDFAARKFAMYGSGRISLDPKHRAYGQVDLIAVQPQSLPTPDNGAFRFARALFELSKEDFPKAQLHIQARLDGGSVSLARANSAQIRVNAGSFGPLY